MHEVAVASVVLGEQQHVVANVLAAGRPIEPGSRRCVSLDPDHRVDARPVGRPIEIDHAVEHSMVGDPDGRLAVGDRCGHHVVDLRRTVEHRELGVRVKMNERLV